VRKPRERESSHAIELPEALDLLHGEIIPIEMKHGILEGAGVSI